MSQAVVCVERNVRLLPCQRMLLCCNAALHRAGSERSLRRSLAGLSPSSQSTSSQTPSQSGEAYAGLTPASVPASMLEGGGGGRIVQDQQLGNFYGFPLYDHTGMKLGKFK